MKTKAFVITVEDLDTNEIKMIGNDNGYPFLTEYFTILRDRGLFDSIVKFTECPDKHYVEMSNDSLNLPYVISNIGGINNIKTAAHVKLSLHEIVATKAGVGSQLLDSYNILMSEGIGYKERHLTKYSAVRNL